MLEQIAIQRESVRKFIVENRFPAQTMSRPAQNPYPGPALICLADLFLEEPEQVFFSPKWNHLRLSLRDWPSSEEHGVDWARERSSNNRYM